MLVESIGVCCGPGQCATPANPRTTRNFWGISDIGHRQRNLVCNAAAYLLAIQAVGHDRTVGVRRFLAKGAPLTRGPIEGHEDPIGLLDTQSLQQGS